MPPETRRPFCIASRRRRRHGPRPHRPLSRAGRGGRGTALAGVREGGGDRRNERWVRGYEKVITNAFGTLAPGARPSADRRRPALGAVGPPFAASEMPENGGGWSETTQDRGERVG
jgi:hypothetical protein